MNVLETLFETGDLLIFEGNSWFSRAIEFCTRSKYSHVAMILKDPTYIDETLKGLYVLESGLELTPDVVGNKIRFGVQIQKIEEVLNTTSNVNIFYRKLECKRGEDFNNTLELIYKKIKDKPYDVNPSDWLRAEVLDQFLNKNSEKTYSDAQKYVEFFANKDQLQRTNTFFCSALIGYVFTQLKFLPENTDWTIIAPVDFSQDRLPLQNCQLLPQITFL